MIATRIYTVLLVLTGDGDQMPTDRQVADLVAEQIHGWPDNVRCIEVATIRTT